MMNKTYLLAHLADLHFDVEHREDAIRSFRHAADVAISRKCDGMVLAGDIWDRSIAVDEVSPLMPVIRIVRDLATHMPVVIVKGNHDKPGSLDVFAELRERYPIVVATEPRSVLVGGIHYSLLPYPTKSALLRWLPDNTSQDESDEIASNAIRQIVVGFAASYAESSAGHPHVLAFHGNVTGCQIESGQTMLGGDVMVSAADLELSGAQYIALGHIHLRQRLGTRCYYPGSLYHCNYGELEAKYMNLVSVTPDGHEIEAVRLPSRPKVVLDVTVNGPAEFVLETETQIPDGADVKVRYRVTEEIAKTVDEDLLCAIAAGAHEVKLERIIIPRERVRSEQIAVAQRLRDKVSAWGAAVAVEIPSPVFDLADAVELEYAGGAR